jgi:hypothetical protein
MKREYILAVIWLLITTIGCTVKPIEFNPLTYEPLNFSTFNDHIPATIRIKMPNTDSTIQINDTTELQIPKNSFIDLEGNILKEYWIFIKPVLKESEMILMNLQTVSNNDFLETMGMLHLDVRSIDGRDVKFNNGKKIDLVVSRKSSDIQQYNLYKGNNNSNGINWNLLKNEAIVSVTPPPKYYPPDSTFLGVNLNSKEAHNNLKRKGVSSKQIDSILSDFQRLKNLYRHVLDLSKIVQHFQINSFGWFNIDKPISQENSSTVNVKLKIQNFRKESQINVFYLIKGKKTFISGKKLNEGEYAINLSKNGIISLPKDWEMVTVIISNFNNDVYVSYKELDLQNGTNVILKKMNDENIVLWLDSITRKYCN